MGGTGGREGQKKKAVVEAVRRPKKKIIIRPMITANRPRPGVDFAAQNRRPVGAIRISRVRVLSHLKNRH